MGNAEHYWIKNYQLSTTFLANHCDSYEMSKQPIP
jgi:hypothetical protein